MSDDRPISCSPIDKARDIFIESGYTMIGRYLWEYWTNGNKTFQIKDDAVISLDGTSTPVLEFLEKYKEVLG